MRALILSPPVFMSLYEPYLVDSVANFFVIFSNPLTPTIFPPHLPQGSKFCLMCGYQSLQLQENNCWKCLPWQLSEAAICEYSRILLENTLLPIFFFLAVVIGSILGLWAIWHLILDYSGSGWQGFLLLSCGPQVGLVMGWPVSQNLWHHYPRIFYIKLNTY